MGSMGSTRRARKVRMMRDRKNTKNLLRTIKRPVMELKEKRAKNRLKELQTNQSPVVAKILKSLMIQTVMEENSKILQIRPMMRGKQMFHTRRKVEVMSKGSNLKVLLVEVRRMASKVTLGNIFQMQRAQTRKESRVIMVSDKAWTMKDLTETRMVPSRRGYERAT